MNGRELAPVYSRELGEMLRERHEERRGRADLERARAELRRAERNDKWRFAVLVILAAALGVSGADLGRDLARNLRSPITVVVLPHPSSAPMYEERDR